MSADGSGLGPERFAEFFAALHSDGGPPRSPFPWQQRLVDQVVTTDRWPDLLDLPTASGKTTTIEIALYLMAAGAPVPRRIVFVVDRRIVVSQAATVAENAARRLDPDRSDILGEVARGLRALAPEPEGPDAPRQPVLQWAELRGGIARDEQWATRPDVPAVVVSTVDQVGSRLLFRGYGVTRGMAPVHAGLLGTDCLFLLDEVHLSRAFAQTLRAVGERYRLPSVDVGRWSVVELSATPGDKPGVVRFSLSEEDQDPETSPVLARRLATAKPARLLAVPVRGRDESAHRQKLAELAANEAARIVTTTSARTVGVIVNRVETARAVQRHLRDRAELDSCLMTGRMRALDRDDLLAAFGSRLAMGRDHSTEARPLVLVATQAIEAGADFDLDAIITECASLDALQQRFGRVRRDGIPTEPLAESVILATAPLVAPGAEDAVYGRALSATWQALDARPGPLDLGPRGFDDLRAELDTGAMSVIPVPAPVLFPRHLDLWSQTSQRPSVDPDPAFWLHGMVPSRPEVSVVWRGDVPDLRVRAFEDDTKDQPENGAERFSDTVGLVPPGSAESISLPLPAVRAWLQGLVPHVAADRPEPDAETIADIDAGVAAEPVPEPDQRHRIAPVLRWAGERSALATAARDLRPGDILVVPAVFGGIQDGTFDPSARGPVSDRATQVAAVQRRRAVLRLRADLLPAELMSVGELPTPAAEGNVEDDRAAVIDWLTRATAAVAASETPGASVARAAVKSLLSEVRRRSSSTVRTVASNSSEATPYLVLVAKRLMPPIVRGASVDTVDEEAPAFTGAQVGLEHHLAHARDWAARLARNCRLPDTVADDLVLAARLHDVGKADPRFQAMLAGGLPPASDAPPLAKSGEIPDLARRRLLHEISGYPSGARHEITGVALMEAEPDVLAGAHDPDLVLHLIASHHGWARPFAPVVVDRGTAIINQEIAGEHFRVPVANSLYRLGSGVAERFWRLTRRYGWYGLAYLEAVLRLADHRASQAEQEAESDESEGEPA